MSFFRYPGGKSKLKHIILNRLNACLDDLEYREPFFGGGSIGLKLILNNSKWKRLWINDKDIGVASLWTAVICYPNELKQLVRNFKPSVSTFDEFKLNLLNISKDSLFVKESDIVECGFKKLVIHQISYSGLGTKSGGPLGGRNQYSKYKIDCRWSPEYICKKIDLLHSQFSQLDIRMGKCTNLDFADLIRTENPACLYLDPPYYIKGNDLYQCGFNELDHIRLANELKITPHYWILSYDNCPEILKLYNWAEIEEISVTYSITALKNKETGKCQSRVKSELLIYPKYFKKMFKC
jgi:DNA adenine methylase